jgi:hypothetical protein
MSRLSDPHTDVVGLTASWAGGVRTVRAGDEDRRRIADLLQAHYVAGRLDADELAERIQRSLGAKTLADLDALHADLPSPAARPEARPRRERRADACGFGGHAWDAGHDALRGEKSFRAHAISYLLVTALLVTIWVLTTPGGYFWPIWPMLGWGIGLASHGLAERGGRRHTGSVSGA